MANLLLFRANDPALSQVVLNEKVLIATELLQLCLARAVVDHIHLAALLVALDSPR